MSNATGTSTTQNRPTLVLVKETNEWGHLTDLEKNTTYFVIRKPTREMTREMRTQFVSDVRSFLHEHRVLSEKQVEELNTKYGEPAKAKAKELRETMEKKFDEIAKEFETRVEQLETEIQSRFGNAKGAKETKDAKTGGPETPGEMPHGEPTEAGADRPRTGAAKKPKKAE